MKAKTKTDFSIGDKFLAETQERGRRVDCHETFLYVCFYLRYIGLIDLRREHLLFDWFGFGRTSKSVVNLAFAKQLNPNQSNRRSALQ